MAAPSFSPEPTASARLAGLRHIAPGAMGGIRRVRQKGGFRYVDAGGRPVRDPGTLDRIRKLVIPPAWKDVWNCPAANGHLQALGRDARGRTQYRYHARWREVRDATKYHKMIAFARALPRIRATCARHLALPGLPRKKVLATAVRLLQLTHIRVGNEEYTRENGSYGLTTLRERHVHIEGAHVSFHFRGKSGKMREVGVHDRRLARIVAQCSELPGHELFHYVDAAGAVRTIDSSDVNDYIHAAAGEPFTAKDFRTWAGTLLAATTLRDLAPGARRHANRNVVECIKSVAAHLGNTPAVCKRSYVHPAILEAYLDGTLSRFGAEMAARAGSRRSRSGGRGEEGFVRAVLEQAARTPPAQKLTESLRASLRAAKAKRAAAAVGSASRDAAVGTRARRQLVAAPRVEHPQRRASSCRNGPERSAETN